MHYYKPYKSCYLFGSLKIFANLQNCVHLIHGPMGCAFFNRNSVFLLNYVEADKFVPKVFSTAFDENDVVFGGRNKLEKALQEIIDVYIPEVVFVYNCCVSEVIGENLEDICQPIMNSTGTRIICIRSAGFKGDHKDGMREASKILFDKFISTSKPEVRKKSLNILGELNLNLLNVEEFCDILKSAKIEINAIIPGKSCISDLSKVVNASLNYVLCGSSAGVLADLLKENFNMPYINDKNGYMGLENCFSILMGIFSFFNVSTVEIEKIYEETSTEVLEWRQYFKGKKAIVVAGSRRAMGYSAILTDLGIEVETIFTESTKQYVGYSDFLKYSRNVLCDEEAVLIDDIIKKNKPDYLITTLPEIILPERFILREDSDFIGFAGIGRMATYLKKIDSGDRERILNIHKS